MRIALLQTNPVIGDIRGNALAIERSAELASQGGAVLAVTSELALTGYPPRDLLLRPSLVRCASRALADLAGRVGGLCPVLVGTVEPNGSEEGRPLFNSAALLRGGKVERCFRKRLLPTYDVFDEDRYFEPSSRTEIFDLDGFPFGITICEDVWNDSDYWKRRRYHADPVGELVRAGARCVLNLSASPFTAGKQALRESMLGALAKKHGVPFLYVNQSGGNDDLVFDGRSMAFDAGGRLLARGGAFREDVLAVDLESPPRLSPEEPWGEEREIWEALVLGTRDYARKCGFRGALLGLSGGIDSALTAAVAVEALGPENVWGVLMPSPYSSAGSVDDSLDLAGRLGIRTSVIPIAKTMDAYDDALRESFAGLGKDVTEENIQARIRGGILMSLSNKFHSLLLTTGNKSELAVGYCTLYGDMSGGLAVVSDVPKTMVYKLSRWLNSTRPTIPEAILLKAPSAELRPGQTDQDSLPPYEVLDQILLLHVEKHLEVEEIAEKGFHRDVVEKVLHLVRVAEFKRRQAAPGLKVTDRAFGVGWRVPIARSTWNSLSAPRQAT